MRKPLIAALILSLACTPEPETSALPDPAMVMSDIETQLLEAERLELDYRVTAEGPFQADIAGRLELTENGARLTGTGTFGFDSVDLWLESDGTELVYGNGPERITTDAPPHLREALVIGLTRMGILHNLARLTANHPPDHADGGAASWVVLDDFSWDAQGDGAGRMAFALAVEGEPSGTASLALDPAGQPAVRRQNVVFTDGEMRVVERYHGVVIEP